VEIMMTLKDAFKLTPAELLAEGYTPIEHDEECGDDGDAENGPHFWHSPAYTEWLKGDQYVIVVDGEVVEHGTNPPECEDLPF
jgi:hypothetical protein